MRKVFVWKKSNVSVLETEDQTHSSVCSQLCVWPPFILGKSPRRNFYPAASELHVRTLLWSLWLKTENTITSSATQGSGLQQILLFQSQVFQCVWNVKMLHLTKSSERVKCPLLSELIREENVKVCLLNKRWMLSCGGGNIWMHYQHFNATFGEWEMLLFGLNYVNVLFVLLFSVYQ